MQIRGTRRAKMVLGGCLLAPAACADDDGREQVFASGSDTDTGMGSEEESSAGVESGETQGGSGDGDGDGDATGDGDGDGDGDGEGECGDGIVEGDEQCDDGVNDGSYGGCSEDCSALGPHCGDGVVGGPEQCDDANAGTADGCLGNCQIPRSCREILEFDPNATDGIYEVAPKGPGYGFTTDCDMSTQGGGWTALPLAELCGDKLDTTLTAVDAAGTEGIDEMCRPYTRDGADAHTYTFDVVFPPGFEAFYLSEDFLVRANAAGDNTSEVIPDNFVQSDWGVANGDLLSQSGDIGFGAGDDPGPAISYGAVLEDSFSCQSCEAAFPGGVTPYLVGSVSTLFRIGWGEVGGQLEGWYPWWAGRVFVR